MSSGQDARRQSRATTLTYGHVRGGRNSIPIAEVSHTEDTAQVERGNLHAGEEPPYTNLQGRGRVEQAQLEAARRSKSIACAITA